MENNIENKDTFNVYNKYLADALAFCGYGYYRFTDNRGKNAYSFKKTEKFMKAFDKIVEVKKTYGQIN
jgi:hypothetical protein